MTSDLVWEEPPTRRGTRRNWNEILKPLMERPGEWARVELYSAHSDTAYGTAAAIRDGRLATELPVQFEAVARRVELDDGPFRAIFVRCVGPKDGS